VSDGTTLLFVSHDQESVRTLTNRALLLNKGRPINWGLSSEVVLEYRKLLHDEEAAYFSRLTKSMVEQNNLALSAKALPTPYSPVLANAADSIAKPCERSRKLSFGDGEVEIIKVETLNSDDQPCSIFYPGDLLRIKVTCHILASIGKLNVSVRLRNKEGVKVYSWGTLNQDMTIRAKNEDAPIFWERRFQPDDSVTVTLECLCSLGANLYEVQAAVSREETPDYMAQRMLHWMDEAAFFQVLLKRNEYFFGGAMDLRIACIVIEHDAVLLTRNTVDFGKVPGLKFENWLD
jgi:lipopolysaccharide transport system ATP-binding protein